MGNIKLVALDMDGTLLNDRQEVSKENAKWIRKATEAGVIVCLATGRGYQSALPYAEQLHLESPMITVNGGEIWARPGVLHKRTLLPLTDLHRLRDLALKHESLWYWAYTTMNVYNKENWQEIEGAVEVQHWLKFGYYTEETAILDAILRETSAWGGLEITNSSPFNLEMNPEGVTKAYGLRELCLLLGLEMSQVAAMGDSLNDIAMIREAGLGVAMGNAQEEVKAAADVVNVTNEEDAVARLLQDYVLKG